MYSPKINPELIPRIYEIAKARGIYMTTLVNEILGNVLDGMEGTETEPKQPNPERSMRDEITDFN
ncbi:MAG: hypothetical protein ACE5KZ_00100 [Candidatus Scalinduaceae bacterium]